MTATKDRMKAMRQRQKDAGLVDVRLKLHPDDAAKIRKAALALNVARLTKEMKEDENDDPNTIPRCNPDRPG